MQRPLFLTGLLVALSATIVAQQALIDTLRYQVTYSPNDTIKLVRLANIYRAYAEINPDSSYYYGEKALELSLRMNYRLDESAALREMGYAMLNRGNYPRALQLMFSALEILENPDTEKNVLVGQFPGDDLQMYRKAPPPAQRLNAFAFTYQNLGILYANANNLEKSAYYHRLAKSTAEESGNLATLSLVYLTMNRVYLQLKKTDSALIIIQRSYDQMIQSGYKKYLGSVLLNTGRTYAALGDIPRAVQYYKESLVASTEHGYFRGVVASSLLLADHYKHTGRMDSAIRYINDAFAAAKNMDAPDLLLRNYMALTNFYKAAGKSDSVVKYQSLIIQINDSIFNSRQVQQFQNIDFDEQQRQQQIEEARAAYRAKMRLNLLLGGLGLFLIIALLLWRNSLQRKRANIILSKQKTELETTLTTLKATQKQLVQAEKMASLGELTAGIAHEIQNPLNFVNNFSEVNKELVDELKSELTAGNLLSATGIADDISENSEKINHHGKRADSIVKGMLQHSRISSGQKELTDINALCNEYLLLAYHGLRTRDKSFHATMKTDFDPGAGQINIVPQDIGRVILNLVNNALYACGEQFRILSSPQKSEHDQSVSSYEPEVMLSTKKQNDRLEIKVTDNGCGIPQEILDKIFQPFFTTKPAGKGTGLGLSISYDIIKAHGGELKAETETGRGSVFTIILGY